jgi:limonene-1,2-epoxide hydrolase
MKNTIEIFYDAFSNLDAETMVSCYHDDIWFEDPAFGKLNGERAKNMWRMLCASQKGKQFKISYKDVISDGLNGSAYWEAEYVFSKTGRKVHNKIEASFKLKDGKIMWHRDEFNLHTWATQALGIKGFFLGGTDFFKAKLNKQTNSLLSAFETANSH